MQTFSVPTAGEREAIVRIDCCTVCGSDLHTITGARTEPVPSILGHEIVGVVTEIGDPPLCDIRGRPLEPGNRVTWSICVSCGACDRCRGGLPQKCRQLLKYGHERALGRAALSGGMAEFILLRPGTAVVRVDRGIPDEVLCPASCATATVAAACRTAGPLNGRRVLIFGAGMLGLTAAAFAKSQEAATVVICDPDVGRLSRAESFGADVSVELHKGAGPIRQQIVQQSESDAFEVILELSGSAAAVEAACELGDIGAKIILVGTVMQSPLVRLDPQNIVRRWLSIHGVHNYAPQDLNTAVRFLERVHTTFPFRDLVEQSCDLPDINMAVKTALKEHPVRVAIHPTVE